MNEESGKREDQVSSDLLDKYFDFFKHLTTLSIAAAVAVLAIYEARKDSLVLSGAPLVAFGFSLLTALSGLNIVMECLKRPGPMRVGLPLLRRRIPVRVYLGQLAELSTVFLVAGLAAFVSSVLG